MRRRPNRGRRCYLTMKLLHKTSLPEMSLPIRSNGRQPPSVGWQFSARKPGIQGAEDERPAECAAGCDAGALPDFPKHDDLRMLDGEQVAAGENASVEAV